MSEEELIGKFGEQYKDSKNKLKTLQSEAQHWSQALTTLAQFLNQMSGQPSSQIDVQSHIKSVPTHEELTVLLTSMAEQARLMKTAQEELKRLGMELK